MSGEKRIISIITIVIALLVFFASILPNSRASENIAMVQVFQPDESAPLPYLFNMIAPADSISQSLRNFIFYKYYFYGFPYFGISALLLLPLKWTGNLTNIPLVMLVLRQFVSVLPMLIGLLLLVYMQDQFHTYRSPLLLVFLLSVPAVVANNLWWHPDGIVFLLVVLTLFFLWRDNLRLGRNFLLAAVMCGIATSAKLMGVYFFLAVLLVIVLGLIKKKTTWKKAAGMGLAFIFIVAASFVIANPFLLSHWARTEYFDIFRRQTSLLSEGYGVVYEKGFQTAWPTVHDYFGGSLLLIIVVGAAIRGSIRGDRQFLQRLILAWCLPVTVVVLCVTHFKFQYWIPAGLPLFSTLIVLLPDKWHFKISNLKQKYLPLAVKVISGIALILVTLQLVIFMRNDVQRFNAYVHRAEQNARIGFYDQVRVSLTPLSNIPLHVYYDYRLYMPATPGWTTETSYELLDYSFIQAGNFDVLVLLEQRIKDYLNPNVEGIDPVGFVLNQAFYGDAEKGAIADYHLVYRNDTGLVFVKTELFQKYFGKN